jgi:hypothetical protein
MSTKELACALSLACHWGSWCDGIQDRFTHATWHTPSRHVAYTDTWAQKDTHTDAHAHSLPGVGKHFGLALGKGVLVALHARLWPRVSERTAILPVHSN